MKVVETRILRLMFGVTRFYAIRNKCNRRRLEVTNIVEKMNEYIETLNVLREEIMKR